MKIVQIFAGKIWGGAEQYVLDLGKSLIGRGHTVKFISNPCDIIRTRVKNEVDLVQIPLSDGLFDGKKIKAMAELLADADVVHIHDTSYVRLVVKACGLAGGHQKIFLTRHIARASRVVPWDRKYFMRLDGIIFVSDLAFRLWHGANGWFPVDKSFVVINSISPRPLEKEIETSELFRSFGIKEDVPLLVFAGRVRKSKGCEVILRALAGLTAYPWQMLFLGAPKPSGYFDKLRALAQKLNIAGRVFFHGFVDNVRPYIDISSLGIAPSIVREACPLVPMEFMEAGKCVIVTSNGAQSEYITDGTTGLIVKENDADALRKAIKAVLFNPGNRDRIGREARKYFHEKMDYDTFVDNILRIYSTPRFLKNE